MAGGEQRHKQHWLIWRAISGNGSVIYCRGNEGQVSSGVRQAVGGQSLTEKSSPTILIIDFKWDQIQLNIFVVWTDKNETFLDFEKLRGTFFTLF